MTFGTDIPEPESLTDLAESRQRPGAPERGPLPLAPGWAPAIAPVALDRAGFQLKQETAAKAAPPRIRCPHCQWQPRRSSTWFCAPVGHPEYFDGGCGQAWNTFDTRGRCTGCGYQWVHTSCLWCGRWARHEDWYEPPAHGESA